MATISRSEYLADQIEILQEQIRRAEYQLARCNDAYLQGTLRAGITVTRRRLAAIKSLATP